MCRNRVTHIIFVPVIMWAMLVWLSKIPVVLVAEKFPFNVSFAVTFLHIFYYILLEPVAGVKHSACSSCFYLLIFCNCLHSLLLPFH